MYFFKCEYINQKKNKKTEWQLIIFSNYFDTFWPAGLLSYLIKWHTFKIIKVVNNAELSFQRSKTMWWRVLFIQTLVISRDWKMNFSSERWCWENIHIPSIHISGSFFLCLVVNRSADTELTCRVLVIRFVGSRRWTRSTLTERWRRGLLLGRKPAFQT